MRGEAVRRIGYNLILELICFAPPSFIFIAKINFNKIKCDENNFTAVRALNHNKDESVWDISLPIKK